MQPIKTPLMPKRMRKKKNQPRKRIRTQQTEGGEDRISSLPDGLIIDEILPRLESTKDAIRTGTLSKRWQYLWPSVSCIFFEKTEPDDEPDDETDEKLYDFYRSIDKTLDQCQSSTNLHKFHVSVAYDSRFKSHIDSWIDFATSRKVQQLELHLSHTDDNYQDELEQFVLEDDSFFINPHFTHLSINYCLFDPIAPSIRWNNLTHLTISFVRLDDYLIPDILSGSPLLDTLKLDNCYAYTRLDITSKSVNNLVIDGYENYFSSPTPIEEIVVEINAPYISSLTIEGQLRLRRIVLRDVSSLVKANFDYELCCDDVHSQEKKMLYRLISNHRHVKQLKVGPSCYEALACLDAKGILHLKGVDVTSPSYSDYLSKSQGDCCANDSSDTYASDTD